ncbi:ribosomal protein L9 [Ehrlichia chaffeensis str. Heartland]|uniref:Large ribosomal subunit protein bL9 n=1 Tax=Ehrlichia chaffeensis (strain ATCC CRL-10679 / Arkansas) TaxID=205920 RepID=RL9_EHRCR|nr:50S ribosomal protein L9 [Ehrlichia chaffeensis]Q2GHF2.1 RecName: Full=Large ribosomal subunit protein bL9; AltName: Full=50S ribosomal protein L9 [Ehrlichia chaffeensis str. Arkansas]ABD45500.1 ribosomal protein L9 [Ehrlichia chaffeensis str. Arkansas]AHX03425.1 ribosomal protein L9 [Ehrlichia chaffeensis str. Heartland]AHX05854.1 ribosomal protein L9 [Ehrlichia chaffeensis str. Jax]AHX06845.1 ribosomal protein L9 [Ehrlichia chaffeensis str. Liberty]AHX07952.1 ribosomal protein L9 [Ehrlic
MLSVILKESVRNLGKAGMVLKVKPGYARYLLTQKKAVRATKENLKSLEEQYLFIEKENLEKLEAAKVLKASLEDEFLIITRQAADDGKLFGSVTPKCISKLLSDKGYNIHYRNIFFYSVIKYIGEYVVNLELHPDLVLPITLYVVKNDLGAMQAQKLHAEKKRKIEEGKVEKGSCTEGESLELGSVDNDINSGNVDSNESEKQDSVSE